MIIVHTLADDTVVLQVLPERRAAYRLEVDVTGTLLGPWRDEELNPAAVGRRRWNAGPPGYAALGDREGR